VSHNNAFYTAGLASQGPPSNADVRRVLTGGNTVNIQNNKDIVRAFYQAGDTGDVEKAMALLSDRICWTNIGSTDFSGTFNGKEDLSANLLGPLFSRLKSGIKTTIDLMLGEGEYVVVQDRGLAETIDGQSYNNVYCHIFRIEDGKIVEVTEFFDTALTQKVLGSVASGS
jgi:ketosteroid isomerase-like protein